MIRPLLLTIGLTALAATGAGAATFDPAPLAPHAGVDRVNRRVARETLGRDLFSNAYASVLVGNVDVYDVFPYLEARYVQVVSDPSWNRLLYGELGGALHAYDGAGTGRLSEPHGMAVDPFGRIYVSDSGNDRIVVLAARTEYDDVSLAPLYTIDGLHRPYDVAFSDGGTPHAGGDDRLYVADTGGNRVVAYGVGGSRATLLSEIGALGGGPGRFAGPTAITVGRSDGRCTADVYVADAHSRRLVHVLDGESGLSWVSARRHDTGVVTSLDTDHWGNLYAVSPASGVSKLSPALVPLAELRDGLERPRSFHVPFVNVHDHRDGSVRRSGRARGILVEAWTRDSGLRLWNLGVEVRDLAVSVDGAIAVRFLLTDRAAVTLEIRDAATGGRVARRVVGPLAAGRHAIGFEESDFMAGIGPGDYVVRLNARSAYEDGAVEVSAAGFSMGTDGFRAAPRRPILLGNRPNPFNPTTRIEFLVPEAGGARAGLRVFDVRGRLVRSMDVYGPGPGLNAFEWDGTDRSGRRLASGVYLYRVRVAGETFDGRMTMVR